jgi:hypothetical protein
MSGLTLAADTFALIDARFIHLSTLIVTPFRERSFFQRLGQQLDATDRRIFSIAPGLRKYAGQTVFRFAEPRPGLTR